MNKKILILEPSSTTQSLITDKLKKTEYIPVFETNGIKFLVSMYNSMPQAVLINARCVSPKSGELVRLIKTVEKFNKIPVGIYSTGDYYFEEHFMINTGTDLFIHLVSDNLAGKIGAMMQTSHDESIRKPMSSDVVKSGIARSEFTFLQNIEDYDLLAENFLNLLTEFCEIPAVSLYVNSEDGTDCFVLCSENFTEVEREEFLKVCLTDFE